MILKSKYVADFEATTEEPETTEIEEVVEEEK